MMQKVLIVLNDRISVYFKDKEQIELSLQGKNDGQAHYLTNILNELDHNYYDHQYKHAKPFMTGSSLNPEIKVLVNGQIIDQI